MSWLVVALSCFDSFRCLIKFYCYKKKKGHLNMHFLTDFGCLLPSFVMMHVDFKFIMQ